jgi:hypothetical protein
MGNLEAFLSFGVNVALHVFILLLFLTLLFFFYISKLTTAHVKHEVEELVHKEIDKFLTKVSEKDKNKYIQWPVVVWLTSRLKENYREELPSVRENNEQLWNDSICFLIIYLIVLVALIVWWKLKGYNLGLKYIAAENFIIFFFVGLVELYFFQNIAAKYIPVTPDTATATIINRLKAKIGQV